MRYLIVGCGNVGLELACRRNEAGHHVTGTTTSAARADEIAAVCSRTAVLRGSDREAVARAAAVPDAAIPPTNREVFAGICAERGWPDLTYRAEIATPVVPVSSAKLRARGLTFSHAA